MPSHQLHNQEPGLSQRLIADATEVPSLDDVWVLHATENPRFVGKGGDVRRVLCRLDGVQNFDGYLLFKPEVTADLCAIDRTERSNSKEFDELVAFNGAREPDGERLSGKPEGRSHDPPTR